MCKNVSFRAYFWVYKQRAGILSVTRIRTLSTCGGRNELYPEPCLPEITLFFAYWCYSARDTTYTYRRRILFIFRCVFFHQGIETRHEEQMMFFVVRRFHTPLCAAQDLHKRHTSCINVHNDNDDSSQSRS